MTAAHEAKTISVDFDGVLHEYYKWGGPEALGLPVEGARDALEGLQARGYRVVINSCRSPMHVRAWLARHGMEDLVDEVTRVKPVAAAYFDDRGVHVPSNQANGLLWAVEHWLIRAGQAALPPERTATEHAVNTRGKPTQRG